ncbi:hypothetical protein [Nocardia puris]|uniref:hypothetical protein n=1 Tax=Nocardia puris TaxID=208602 RepID=UPI002E1DB304
MTEFGFVTVRFTTRERLLLRGNGPSLAPVTLPVINGSVLRGILAQRCARDPDLLERVIISGSIAAAPGFPVIDVDGMERVAFPAPRNLTRVRTEPGLDSAAFDGRAHIAGDQTIESVRGLVAFAGRQWIPAQIRVNTHTRLVRPRAGGTREGLGPLSFTTLDPHHVFEARLRLRGDIERRRALRADLAGLFDNRGPVVFGSGADGSYGGEAVVEVGPLVDDADPWPIRTVVAGESVDLVLRSPALVADPGTGHYDPTALAHHLTALLVAHDVAAHVVDSSVVGAEVGGAHAGYGRMRPDHWAAAAGSVLTVRCEADVTERDWRRLLAHRVGARTIDGLGVLAMVPPIAHTIVTAPTPSLARTPHGLEPLASGPPAQPVPPETTTGTAASQLELLRDQLCGRASDRWVDDAAVTMVEAVGDAALGLGVSLLGRLRTAVNDPADLTELLAGDAPETPGTDQLRHCRLSGTSLHAWFTAAISAEYEILDEAWQIELDGSTLFENWRTAVEYDALDEHDREGLPAARWMEDNRRAVLLELVRAVVSTLYRVRPRPAADSSAS